MSTPARSGPTAGGSEPALVLAGLSGAALLVLAGVMGRRLWFFSDDWNIYADYHTGNLLEPFNGHLSLVPAGLYQLLFHTVGVGSYLPYRLCGLVALGILAFQVGRFSHRRVGAQAAVLAVTAVMWNSAGNTDVLFPFLMNFSLPIAALVALWWHLDRDEPRHDAAAAAWVAVALATSGLGVMVLVAVVVELAVGRARWRRWAMLSPGVLAWGAWYLTHRDSSSVSRDVGAVVSYSARMFLGGTTSLAAGWRPGGVVLAVGFVAVVAVAGLRWRSLDARSLGALAAGAAFIGSTALTRLTITPRIPPDELRYRWAVAAYLVLAVVVMWRPRRDPDAGDDEDPAPRPLSPLVARAAMAGAFVVLALGAVQLVGGMREWTDKVAGAAPGLRAVLFSTEAVGPRRIDGDMRLPLSYVPVTASGYLGAVAAVGSPIAGVDPTDGDLVGGTEVARLDADRILVEQLPIRAVGPPADTAPGECRGTLDPAAIPPGSTVEVTGGVADVNRPISIARFSGSPTVAVPADAASTLLVIPADAPAVAFAGRELPYRIDVPGTELHLCR